MDRIGFACEAAASGKLQFSPRKAVLEFPRRLLDRAAEENLAYKEILAFIDGKQLTHDETQQEIGKRNYQKIIFAFIAGVIALIICFVVIFICQHLTN